MDAGIGDGCGPSISAILLATFGSLNLSGNGENLGCIEDNDKGGLEEPVDRDEDSLLFNNGVDVVQLVR